MRMLVLSCQRNEGNRMTGETNRPQERSPEACQTQRRVLLLDVLLLGDGLVEFGRFVLGSGDAERLLEELAGLQAIGAGVALCLDGSFAGGRHGDFDDASHLDFSKGM